MYRNDKFRAKWNWNRRKSKIIKVFSKYVSSSFFAFLFTRHKFNYVLPTFSFFFCIFSSSSLYQSASKRVLVSFAFFIPLCHSFFQQLRNKVVWFNLIFLLFCFSPFNISVLFFSFYVSQNSRNKSCTFPRYFVIFPSDRFEWLTRVFNNVRQRDRK